MTTFDEPPKPYDPMCNRYAADMTDLDVMIALEDRVYITPEDRELYIRYEEGTYNPENGHFLCDDCYIQAGMPSSPEGWKCP